MKDLFKTVKFWEIVFIALSIILASPLFLEFLIFTIMPLSIVGIIPAVLAIKKKNFYIAILNTFIVVGLAAVYFYLL